MTRREEIKKQADIYTEITLTDVFETAFRQAMEGGAK